MMRRKEAENEWILYKYILVSVHVSCIS